MAETDDNPFDRETCAAYLRDLADRVEDGSVEGLWVVATPVPGKHVEGHLSLLGPSPDSTALAKLMWVDDLQRHQLRASVIGGVLMEVTNRKTGPRDPEGRLDMADGGIDLSEAARITEALADRWPGCVVRRLPDGHHEVQQADGTVIARAEGLGDVLRAAGRLALRPSAARRLGLGGGTGTRREGR